MPNEYASLIPGNTATAAPKTAPNQYASLIPKATPAPVQPQGTLVGQTIAGLPAAATEVGQFIGNQIVGAAKSSFQQGVQAVDTMQQPSATPIATGLSAGLQLGAGVAGVAFSPLAPMTNLISKAIDFAGNQLANVPAVQEFAKTSTPQDTQVLTDLQNLGGIAMGILGAKAGDITSADIPPAKLAEIAQHPDVIAAAQKLAESQKAVPPEAQANLQKLVETQTKPTPTIPNQFDHLIPKPEAMKRFSDDALST